MDEDEVFLDYSQDGEADDEDDYWLGDDYDPWSVRESDLLNLESK